MDFRSVQLKLTVKSIQCLLLHDEKASPMTAPRGMLTSKTMVNFRQGQGAVIPLKASSKRAPVNAIIRPDFKFEEMGIGGLDIEFATIFRRAFASRIFPPGLIEKIGIQH